MDNGTSVARRPGLRRAAALAALASILSLFVIVQQPASAAPAGGAGVSAQVDFGQLACPTLFELRDEYDDSPFFASIVPIIDDLLVEFGCIGAPTTTTTVAPTTTTTVAPTTTTTVGPAPTIPDGPFAQIACSVLLGVREAFEDSPFFSAFVPFIDMAIASFACGVSG